MVQAERTPNTMTVTIKIQAFFIAFGGVGLIGMRLFAATVPSKWGSVEQKSSSPLRLNLFRRGSTQVSIGPGWHYPDVGGPGVAHRRNARLTLSFPVGDAKRVRSSSSNISSRVAKDQSSDLTSEPKRSGWDATSTK